jgi:hypothetical protein
MNNSEQRAIQTQTTMLKCVEYFPNTPLPCLAQEAAP